MNTKRTEKTETPSGSFWYKVNNTGTSNGSHIGSYNANNDTYYFGKATVTTGDDGVLYVVVAGSINAVYEYFNEFQLVEGTTLPEYEPYGYKIPVTVSGKNVLDITSPKSDDEITCNVIDDDTIEVSTNVANKTISYLVKVVPNATYAITMGTPTYISGIGSGIVGSVVTVYDGNSESDSKLLDLASIWPDSSKKFFTPTTDTALISFTISGGSGGAKYQLSKYLISPVGVGETYETYMNPITTNIYLDQPLRKVGDVADYIDFKNQKVVRYIKEENGVLSVLETPTEEAISLPQIPTFEGTANITVNTTVAPSKIEVNYESK